MRWFNSSYWQFSTSAKATWRTAATSPQMRIVFIGVIAYLIPSSCKVRAVIAVGITSMQMNAQQASTTYRCQDTEAVHVESPQGHNAWNGTVRQPYSLHLQSLSLKP